MMKSLKGMLQEQDLVVGLMVQRVCSPWIAKVYADAGADFVYVESEHLFFNEADLADLVLANRLCGLPVVAKCSYVDRGHVCKLLDAGVTGVQLPMTETADQIAQIVAYTKFSPMGVRAAAPGLGNTDYESVDVAAWLERMNQETTVLAHIETRTGVENVDAILDVRGVDIMFIGMMDLTVSLGRPAKYDHPDVTAAVDRLVAAARAHDKVAGMWAPSFEVARPWIDKGIRFFESAGDVDFVAQSAGALMKQFPGHGPRIPGGDGHV